SCHMEVAPAASSEPSAKTAAPAGTQDATIGNYWPRYKRQATLITIVMQLVVGAVVSMALSAGGIPLDSPLFWITLLATFLVSVVLNLSLVHILLTPLRDMVNVLKSTRDEKLTEPLANPNTPRYERDGFKPVLQSIYDIASEDQKLAARNAADPLAPTLKAALHQTQMGVIVMDTQGTIVYANEAAPVSEDTNGGKKLDLLFEQEDTFAKWLASCRENAVHAQHTWLRISDRIVGDDARRIFNVSANYEKGSVAEVVLTCFDSTDIYQPEDNDLDFIAFAAHELRGPITVIRGYLDVLDMELEGVFAPDQKELMKRLIVSANRLTGYINNILNTSKFDRRHLVLHLSEESLTSIYDIISDDMSLRASSQNRLLAVDIPANLPTVAADRSSISEVISNLIDNAIKYSNEGGPIAVSARQTDGYVEVSITDHGIGMPGNVVGNLFHKFYRSHRSRETVAGTGIGLYICKAIVESHGGKIGVTSTEGEGSTFSFTVPIYATVADKLQANDYTNAGLITNGEGWIKNHAKFTG
ncbi:MAG: PAS domain-containing sensor histidine kinase, partial [Candidatus Saccharimonas sp.]